VDELWLIPGALVVQAKVGGLRPLHNVALHWGGGPSRWPWEMVLEALCCAAGYNVQG
jgi:hypothetical protein